MMFAIAPMRGDTRARARIVPRASAVPRALLPLAACALLLPAACSSRPDEAPPANPRALASSEPATLLAALAPLGEYATLRRIVALTGHEPLLAGRQGYTLLAPRDTAFVQLDPERRLALEAPANRAALTRAVDALLVPRILRADELRRLIALGGGSLTLPTRAGSLVVTQGQGGVLIVTTPSGTTATIGSTELATGNGTLYVLDRWIADTP